MLPDTYVDRLAKMPRRRRVGVRTAFAKHKFAPNAFLFCAIPALAIPIGPGNRLNYDVKPLARLSRLPERLREVRQEDAVKDAVLNPVKVADRGRELRDPSGGAATYKQHRLEAATIDPPEFERVARRIVDKACRRA